MTDLAVLDFQEGYLVSAVERFEKIVVLLPDEGLAITRAWVHDSLAAAHSYLGHFDEALQNYQIALSVHRDIDDRHGEADSLMGLGRTYLSIGELDLASSYLTEALYLTDETGDGSAREAALRYLGNVEYLSGNYSQALSYHNRALSVATSTRYRSTLRLLLARDLNALGQYEEAVSMANQVLSIVENGRSQYQRAEALLALGQISIRKKETLIAEKYLSTALDIYESLRLSVQQAEALHGLALARAARGDLSKAVLYGARSLQSLEVMRGNTVDPEMRAFYSATKRSHYDTQISWLMTLQENGEISQGKALLDAFSIAEQARARMTIDLLNEASVDFRQTMDTGLSQKHKDGLNRLAELRYQRGKLIYGADAKLSSEKELSKIVTAMAEAEHELNIIEIELRRSNPTLSSLIESKALSATEIQALLDNDTTLLQYALGEKHSYVWVVTNQSVVGVKLPSQNEIEMAARQLFEQLRIFRPDGTAHEKSEKLLRTVSNLVLAPVEDMLHGKRLLIAADGGLQYLPFGVLPMRSDNDKRLISRESTLLVIADPVFTAEDPRFRPAQNPSLSRLTNGATATRYSNFLDDLDRLVYTGREAESIASLVPAASRRLLTGFDANRDVFLKTDLREFRYIHVATHGLIDARYPLLSALALSRYGADGLPRDALLTLDNIYDMRLNADLVVLSACDTALGRNIRGEGLIGLTQGFLYAGARSLVVSLWQVPDRATSELMSSFYRYLLAEELTPARALRQAQLQIASQKRWSEPYFWAAMMLVGDWQ
jgi:CHAT domain-containing protein